MVLGFIFSRLISLIPKATILGIVIWVILKFIMCLFKKKIKFNIFSQCLWFGLVNERVSIVDDLILSDKAINLTKFEIINFLGYGINEMDSDVFIYFLGRKNIYSKNRYLLVCFNEKGKSFRVFKSKLCTP